MSIGILRIGIRAEGFTYLAPEVLFRKGKLLWVCKELKAHPTLSDLVGPIFVRKYAKRFPSDRGILPREDVECVEQVRVEVVHNLDGFPGEGLAVLANDVAL